jgi:hypothetical protein
MKTRPEMIYDFMVALASNPELVEMTGSPDAFAEYVHKYASALAQQFLDAGGF